MNERYDKLIAGWGGPLLAKKVHYFRDGEIISECGKWMFGGGREDISAWKPDAVCKQCLKKHEKMEKM
ncbi:hypothetical protein KGB36_gp71 [Shigella phage Sf11 SMD-2017]|uniref:Uncharacterized protein n=1 Tax=Shigella phage Sf11 SMD-2017 TaxID=2282196 RepID=A0A291AXE7_9CAUD|nr:hypothetical protein KGB36_gp71 [Shigella phage Sf11 SMD-2017]ATE85681.1 hypothetical protein Sf11_gp34 [Shigella phage Sf11 SMD-2017]